ncbi:ATP-binding cassette domain-containing protein [Corynebacterium coyleae]|uniref:ATP-binding cassette domain-containing protein n=1 Tax=Corynebacterium coyleae TaxID=53374 RepID=UPI00254DAE02|nr:ABC transporter ATP-binding protein [Corynebacterium coyleae]MDK8664226.1 ABC transporter ATP-binding protein [Corynebacterium coyleae]MDK8707278.1 ABC transporter ATP-binding protein [Corynebacterium coyleae]MDK8734080.1 ABC transporter ATP-binding protein [Corynebacterium coyleae]MDK8893323.1 ABC transporter ATP-binding protein [Corynebacterium coyleae]
MIDVKHLSIDGILHDITFHIAAGERVGIIGESGSGKSVTALSIMGLSDLPATGSITVNGTEMVGTRDRVRRRVRGKNVAMVFQEPMTALDPLKKIGRIVSRDLLQDVGVDRPDAYPHELSGGQRQRVLIALALSQNPDVLICDEPTTALDAIVQSDILDLLDRLVRERGMGLLFISHDLAVVRRMTDRVLVFKDGRIVAGDSDYAKALAAAAEPGAPAAPVTLGEPVVELDGVSLQRGATMAVDNVTLTVREGERLAIVGGSGSGKTSLLHLIAGLRQATSGTVTVAGDVQMVFQDPYSSLDPRMEVGASIREVGVDKQRSDEMLERVGLAGTGHRKPAQFSGGQRQRISIARAAAPRPSILLADEPVSALDATIQDQVLDLLRDTIGANTLIFVTHDLNVARELCPTVAVMQSGRIVEQGPTEEIWANPQHPYTRELLAAVL